MRFPKKKRNKPEGPYKMNKWNARPPVSKTKLAILTVRPKTPIRPESPRSVNESMVKFMIGDDRNSGYQWTQNLKTGDKDLILR